MQTQAQMFMNRAKEYEKRAAQNRDGKLRFTLLRLADYYREMSKQASRQNK
jgi:hypothetical protein